VVRDLKKGNIFSLLDHTMPPKLTPLFHPESNEEADKVIQEAEDVKVQLACMNAGRSSLTEKRGGLGPQKPRSSRSGKLAK